MHEFTRPDRPSPLCGWDGAGPDYPFLSVRILVPLRPCLALTFSSKQLTGCYIAGSVWLQYMAHMRDIWSVVFWRRLPSQSAWLCFALHCFASSTPSAVGGVVLLPSMYNFIPGALSSSSQLECTASTHHPHSVAHSARALAHATIHCAGQAAEQLIICRCAVHTLMDVQ
jgi:hypothetical protein